MLCETPALDLSLETLNLLPPPTATTGRRRRRQTNAGQTTFRAGYELGGVTDYEDLREITVHRDPVIERSEEPLDHRPFWPFNHQNFEIKVSCPLSSTFLIKTYISKTILRTDNYHRIL